MSRSEKRVDDTTTLRVDSRAFAVTIEAVTELAAPAGAVWDVLAATGSYGSWNPFVTRFEGELAVGERVGVTLVVPDRRPQTMHPRIVEVDPGRRFAWLGRVGPPGVLDGRHRFTVEPLDGGRCRLVQHERLSGALVPLVRSTLTTRTPEAFVALNHAVADRVARPAGPP